MADKSFSDRITNLENMWRGRNSVIEEERRILRLESSVTRKKGFDEIILNEPKVLYETGVALLSSFPPRFRLPIKHDATDDERKKMNKAERFLVGIYRELNRHQVEMGKENWLRELAYWVCSGWVSIFPHISIENGHTVFRAEFFDPITVYPRWGSTGLREVARIEDISGEDATAMAIAWGITNYQSTEKTVKLINYWEEKPDGIYNTIKFGDREIKPETKESFDRIPIVVTVANGVPERSGNSRDMWTKRAGQSIIASDKTMYDFLNKWVTTMSQIASESAYPPLQTESETGEAIVGKDDLGTGAVIPTKIGERIHPIERTTVPIEVNNILSMLTAGIQRGGLPYIIYGGLPFELSGFAISQLMMAVRYKLAPYTNCIQDTLSLVSTEFLHQFKAGGGKVTLSTVEKYTKGEFFMEEYMRQDIPEVTYVEVTLPLGTPQDKLQQMLIARQAMQPPALLSRETLWEDLLDIEDYDLEYKRIIKDATGELPAVKMISIIEDLRKRAMDAYNEGRQDDSRVLINYANVLFQQLQQGSSGAQGGGQQGQTAPPGTPGRIGMPTQGLTPEQVRAAIGTAQPGVKAPVTAPVAGGG